VTFNALSHDTKLIFE